mmetsp:Transcript_36417/g.47787  ORF Transcript_36417/g.47787 Transcript_36417/m.47787 type:complete len:165 (+) Transcript_36417:259-753(+)
MYRTTRDAIPSSLSLVLTYGIGLINLYFIGNLNDTELLAGVGLAISLTNMIAFSFAVGFADTSSSFFSQSFGSGRLEECGAYLMRTKFVVHVIMLGCTLLFFHMEPLLVNMGQDPGTASIASKLCFMMTPGTWFMCLFEADVRFLMSQFHFKAPLVVLILVIPF